METIKKTPFTPKQILQENWDRFLDTYREDDECYTTLNVWRVTNLPDYVTPPRKNQANLLRWRIFFSQVDEKEY